MLNDQRNVILSAWRAREGKRVVDFLNEEEKRSLMYFEEDGTSCFYQKL